MSNTSLSASQPDFSEMENAQISSHHWKIMFISGMGFFTDAYDLFIIGVVSWGAKQSSVWDLE
jgi:hypothetical protein